jgi:arylsulfatase A-like enzyme
MGGRVLDGLVSHIDLFPTLCELAGIARPAWLQGKSLMPLLKGEAREVNEEIFAEVTFHAAEEPQRGVRTRRYQYIRRFDDRQTPVMPNCDDSASKEVWVKSGWVARAPQAEQLYDLVFDPNEACNLAGRPEMAGVLEEMRARLRRWMETTGDPLLQGRVRAPAGAQLNDPDGYSPSEPTFTVD